MAAHEALNGELFPGTAGPTRYTEWQAPKMTPRGEVSHPAEGDWQRRPANQPLRMFHSAREIMEGWRPAEGDRRYVDTMFPAGGERRPQKIFTNKPPVPAETDQQMWDRKLDEAHSVGYAEHMGRERSLVQHLSATRAADMPPIPLGHLANRIDKWKDPRPMVAGGQHRIAAMMHLNPDQLLPVIHHEDIVEAKMTRGYT